MQKEDRLKVHAKQLKKIVNSKENTHLIISLWGASLDTAAGEKKERWDTRIAPMLGSNLRQHSSFDVQNCLYKSKVPQHNWARYWLP